MKDVSIVIVSFNTLDLTLACIDSVIKQTKGVSYEIIVIDNGSDDGSLQSLRKLSKIKLIKNNQNLGFAKANNQGVQAAKAKYVLLLNSDTKLSKDVITNSVNWMNMHHDVGIFSCSLKNKDDSQQANGGYFPNLPRVISWMFFIDNLPIFPKAYHPNSGYFNRSHYQDWVTGAFFLIRREVLSDIGGLDEKYFMYIEDMDYCFEARKVGWKVFYNADLSITHFGGASSSSSFQRVSEFKGLRLFFRKHYLGWQVAVLRLILKTGSLFRVIFFGFLKGPKWGKIYLDAFKIA